MSVQGHLLQDVTNKLEAQSQYRLFWKAVDHESLFPNEYSTEFYGWTAKTADIGTSIW